MLDEDVPGRIAGCAVITADGQTVGQVRRIRVHAGTGRPAWVDIETGQNGCGTAVAPLTHAVVSGEVLKLPVDRGTVEGAPDVVAGQHLGPEDEERLYQHYGARHRIERASTSQTRVTAPVVAPEPVRARR